jgi:hypothetical protein
MAILELKATRAWSLAQTARAFLVEPETIASGFRARSVSPVNGAILGSGWTL